MFCNKITFLLATINFLALHLERFVNDDEVGILAPIVVVMLPEALAFEALAQHLNG